MAASIASAIVSYPYDVLTLVYNHYENQVKFTTVFKKIPQFAGLPVGVMPGTFKGYDVEPENNEEALVNMQEYAIASSILFAMLETQACETSQRVTAMDNASTNAKDMVDAFKLLYNRARQSKITTELTVRQAAPAGRRAASSSARARCAPTTSLNPIPYPRALCACRRSSAAPTPPSSTSCPSRLESVASIRTSKVYDAERMCGCVAVVRG